MLTLAVNGDMSNNLSFMRYDIILIFGTAGQLWVKNNKLTKIFEIFAIKICEIRCISKIFKQFFLIQQYTTIQKMIQGRNMNLNKLFLCNIIFKKS